MFNRMIFGFIDKAQYVIKNKQKTDLRDITEGITTMFANFYQMICRAYEIDYFPRKDISQFVFYLQKEFQIEMHIR